MRLLSRWEELTNVKVLWEADFGWRYFIGRCPQSLESSNREMVKREYIRVRRQGAAEAAPFVLGEKKTEKCQNRS